MLLMFSTLGSATVAIACPPLWDDPEKPVISRLPCSGKGRNPSALRCFELLPEPQKTGRPIAKRASCFPVEAPRDRCEVGPENEDARVALAHELQEGVDRVRA